MHTEANADFSARECDALKDEDVTPLPESQPHVVFVRSLGILTYELPYVPC